MKPAIDDIFIKKNVLTLKLIPLAIIAVMLIKGIADYVQSYFMIYVGLSVFRDIRDELYSHLQTLSISFFSKTQTGMLISRITSDVNIIQSAVSDTINTVIKDFFTLIALTRCRSLSGLEISYHGPPCVPLGSHPDAEIRQTGPKTRYPRTGENGRYLHAPSRNFHWSSDYQGLWHGIL